MPAYAEKGENLAITIHENSFELTKEFSVRKGETCRALVAPRRHGRRRALLAASLAALPLLFPKNLAALRFSGALIDAPCWRRFLPSAPRISGHTIYKTRGAVTSIQTKSKQKGPALKGVFCAPCGSSSLQYRSGYCCFVYRPNPSQNALFQGAKQSQAGRLPQMQGKARR